MSRTVSSSSAGAAPVAWSKWMRQTHRWLSVAFTLAVVANVIALAVEQRAVWIGLVALFPLLLLLGTGLSLFVLPYAARRRGGPPRVE